jgi:hypothetical protein
MASEWMAVKAQSGLLRWPIYCHFPQADRFISRAESSAQHTGQWVSLNAWKKSMRDRLEVIRQTLFGFSQDFHDGLTVGE